MTTSRAPRRASLVLLLGLCLMVLSALPPRSAQAAVTVRRTLDNTTAEFTRGSFQRSALGALQATEVSARDQPGAVQLSPIGVLKRWPNFSSKNLPYRLSNMGATSVGSRIYVIGGVASLGTSATQTISDVVSAQISLTTGDISDAGWEAEPPLPPVRARARNDIPNTFAPVSSPAVTSVTTSGNSGYIYVIGGSVGTGTQTSSSYAVHIGTVGANGRISGWQTGASIPASGGDSQHGVQAASAASIKIGNDFYVYLIGGQKRYIEGVGGATVTRSKGSRAVFRAKVGAGGKLLNRDGQEGWDVMPDIPIDFDIPAGTENVAGLWDATAVLDRYPTQQGVGSDKALYLIGGQLVAPPEQVTYSSKVYRALIDDNGELEWSAWSGTLPESRIGHGGVTFRGNHYLTGGLAGNSTEPTLDVLTSYVEDELTLPTFGTGPGGSSFLKSDTLPDKRAFHSTVLVPTTDRSAFIYVIGGQSGTVGDTTTRTDSIAYGRIGDLEDVQTTGYAPDGWYYSKPYAINILQAEIREISWSTLITRTSVPNMDIEMDYRVSSDDNCETPVLLNATPWEPGALDGAPGDAQFRSLPGNNTQILQDVPARCFQYRARLVSGSFESLPRETPSLLNVNILVVIPGSPDLKVRTLQEDRDGAGRMTGLRVEITNHNGKADDPDPSKREPTQPVNIDESGGSFFVDLFIYKEGDAFTEPTLPLGPSSPPSTACATVLKTDMTPDRVLGINQWYAASNTSSCNSNPVDVLGLIAQRGPGKYIVFVAVDSYGCNGTYACVDERDAAPGEADNVTRYEFTLAAPSDGGGIISRQIRLPLISRRP